MAQKRKIKRGRDEESLWKKKVVTPLREGGNPRWGVKEPPLEVLHTQDKTQNTRRLSSLITPAEFPFYFKIQCVKYMRQDTIFIGENVLENKIEG